MNIDQYLGVFIEESKENLQNLNTQLLALEARPEDETTIKEIFRVAHTLKGMSGSMGFVKMQRLTHSAENVLSDIRSGKIKVSAELLDVLFQSMDALEHYIEAIESTSSEGTEDYSDIIEQLDAIAGGLSVGDNKSPKPAMQGIVLDATQESIKNKALKLGMNSFEVSVIITEDCVLKAPRAFLVFKMLEELGEVICAVPEIKDIEDEKFDREFKVVLITKKPLETVQISLENISDIEKISIKALELSEEAIVESSIQPEATTKKEIAQPDQKEKVTASTQNNANKTVRVSIERLDTLMNLVSELIIVKTQLEGGSVESANYGDSVEYLERVTSSLHDAVMKVRMVPVENVFNRFPRMLRDISRKLGKDIELTMSGEDTELDRTVVDEIGDPLIHLLRNAADHGLETIEERVADGKPKTGHITLKAYQDGNNVIIEVSDDGKGIDVQRIKNKALSNGTVSQEEVATMSDKDIVNLLFKPSFSTAEEITDLSGRGVGLDVVKSKIADLGGTVEVKTELGKGSTFIVRLPLTLAIIQALMVKIGSEKYAMPLGNIQTIETVKKTDVKLVQNQEVIVLRDQAIPIMKLHDILEVEEPTGADSIQVVIVKKSDRYVGFTIDELIGQQEIVVKSLGKHLSGLSMIVGATILGNGEVTLILDVNTLV